MTPEDIGRVIVDVWTTSQLDNWLANGQYTIRPMILGPVQMWKELLPTGRVRMQASTLAMKQILHIIVYLKP